MGFEWLQFLLLMLDRGTALREGVAGRVSFNLRVLLRPLLLNSELLLLQLLLSKLVLSLRGLRLDESL